MHHLNETTSYSDQLTKTMQFNLNVIHPTWQDCVQRGLEQVNPDYLRELQSVSHWLPGPQKIFNAFSLPLNQVNYILFGESPYPRKESANGYAFWDASVKELWSDTGLSKKVNRATSLRHLMKMLLLAQGSLSKNNVSQETIAAINKDAYVKTGNELFENFLAAGFLLLNATPVLNLTPRHKDAKFWQPFVRTLLECIAEKRPQVKIILLGQIAKNINPIVSDLHLETFQAEHPYNISFVTNKNVLDFFRPFNLLLKK